MNDIANHQRRRNIYYFYHSFIQYNHTFFHPSSFAEARLLVSSSLLRSSRDASMGCCAENRTLVCLTASQRSTNWAAPNDLRLTLIYREKTGTFIYPIIFDHKFLCFRQLLSYSALCCCHERSCGWRNYRPFYIFSSVKVDIKTHPRICWGCDMEDGRMDRELSFLYSFYVPNTYCFIWSINRFAL